eukprot:TRINITY_DN4762_c0_g2_i2.p1 TRINITY_DN4762_c0_g2~~TRINITY_DN4762_c0_g2_i2.p1  ORF type:complete len:245 (+),score=52.98 TRINITY_DN4762_c0_g2_i2:616-1350(+)
MTPAPPVYAVAQSYAPAPATAATIAYPAPNVFEQIDANHDGVITQAEFAAAVQPPTYAVQTVQAAPQYYSAPQPAPVSYLPPVTASPVTYAAPQVVSVSAPVASAFNQLDTNHDGVITRAEFAAAVQQPTYAVQTVQAAPQYYSAPQPAPVSYLPPVTASPVTYAAPQVVSVSAPVASAFNQLDTNHDGVITRAEFAAAVQPPTYAVQTVQAAPQYAMSAVQTVQAAPQYVSAPQPYQCLMCRL